MGTFPETLISTAQKWYCTWISHFLGFSRKCESITKVYQIVEIDRSSTSFHLFSFQKKLFFLYLFKCSWEGIWNGMTHFGLLFVKSSPHEQRQRNNDQSRKSFLFMNVNLALWNCFYSSFSDAKRKKKHKIIQNSSFEIIIIIQAELLAERNEKLFSRSRIEIKCK